MAVRALGDFFVLKTEDSQKPLRRQVALFKADLAQAQRRARARLRRLQPQALRELGVRQPAPAKGDLTEQTSFREVRAQGFESQELDPEELFQLFESQKAVLEEEKAEGSEGGGLGLKVDARFQRL